MLKVLRSNGLFYISFPSEKSVTFPRRFGTLNYYDDDTHLDSPPKFDDIISALNRAGFDILFSSKRYQPFILYWVGFFLEPLSRLKSKIFVGTWEYYGFESIIWARKR